MISLKQFKYPTVSPSILSMDNTKSASEIDLIRKSGLNFVHIDIMDGKFVPNCSFSDKEMEYISKDSYGLVNDVHIMVVEPWKVIDKYASYGADIITFHYEACPSGKDVMNTINAIREKGINVGISISPDTNPNVLDPYLDLVDLVLIMSVYPGKGGQKFMPNSLDKIRYIKNKRKEVVVEVDGGINGETSVLVRDAGVDLLVAGSYLFGHDDFVDRSKGLLK